MGARADGIPPEKSLSIVIPAYNEERRIGKTLSSVVAYLADRAPRFEVIVVDDGSVDATRELVGEVAAREPRVRLLALGANRGKGMAVRRGMLEARGDWLLFSDADLSTPIEEAERLAAAIGAGADIAIGSRSLRGARVEVHQPWCREAMGKTFNRIVRVLAVRGFVDTQCGFKCFTREAARAVFERARIDRFAFDVEALVIARRLGFRIAEVPIRWANEPNSRVAIVSDSARMLADLLRIRWNALAGVYGPPASGSASSA
jgi:dolichyl-phosphate beta-glucosyltransferase